ALLPRRQGQRDRRGHQRGPAHAHRAPPPRALRHPVGAKSQVKPVHPGLLQGEKSSEMMVADGDPVLTVVVMGYRNEATILRSIRSVVDQSSDDPFEIVVVTSGGDHSADLVAQAFPHLSVVDSSSRLFPGGARNAGIRM